MSKIRVPVNGHKRSDKSTLIKRQAEAFDALACGMAIIDRLGSFRYVNKALAGLHGCKSASAILGKPLETLFTATESLRFRSEILPACRNAGHWKGQAFGVRRDGSPFPLELSMTALSGEDYAYAAQDISARLRASAERELLLSCEKTARLEAERAIRAKDEFLAVISHELRTPLTAMLGWTMLLREGAISHAEQRKAIDIIERNMKIQTQIIEDMLDVSSMTTGKLRVEVKPTDLSAIISGAMDSIRPEASRHSLVLQMDIPETEVIVNGDPERLHQVLWNLLSNAIKFTPAGGRIKAVLKIKESLAEISIADTGKGINADFLPYVFDRFRQEERALTRSHRGLGLGLAIVRYIVEQHGGAVHVDSRGPGLGSTFTVTLPLA